MFVSAKSPDDVNEMVNKDDPSLFDICTNENDYNNGMLVETVKPGKAHSNDNKWILKEIPKIKFV